MLLFVYSLLAAGASETIYTNDWAVEIDGGLEEATRVASRYGFVNIGTVGFPGMPRHNILRRLLLHILLR